MPNVMGGYLEKGAKAVIDMQEELRNQALKLFSGFPYAAQRAPRPSPRPSPKRSRAPQGRAEAKKRGASNRMKTPREAQRPTPAPRVGFVSLGCPKALVDSESILTQLSAEGYDIAPSYEGSDLVVVNTCGFIDAAVQESLDAIGEALAENGKVIVTGCLGAKDDVVQKAHPKRARGHRPACAATK